MFRTNQTLFISIIFLITIIVFLKRNSLNSNFEECANEKKANDVIKDFERYECKDRKRIGGFPEKISKTNDPLWRIDGAWFVCFDENLAPKRDSCNVLSFGISSDESFDFDFNKNYGCNVFSFDPFFEAETFSKIRQSNPLLKDSNLIKVNSKWFFYRIGVTGSKKNSKDPKKIGGLDTLENILELTNLQNKIIDVFKMDIEKAEINVLENLDLDYACKYYKQFVLETHPQTSSEIFSRYTYILLQKLNKCFLLFHRDTRFFKGKWAFYFYF
jgi:hypothetical protein